MPPENFGSNIEKQEQLKLKVVSSEEIKKVEKDIDYSKHLTKVNDVLKVLDFPDNKEESFRKTLNIQDNETLKELSWKPKSEILLFIANEKEKITEFKEDTTINIEAKEVEKQNIENEKINQKISKIKSIFSNDILDKNPNIAEKLNSLNTLSEALEKDKVLQEVLQILKTPWKLKSILDDLGWVDENNPKYLKFKNNLLGIDSSFESYFNNLENIDTWVSLSTNEVINFIEKDSWWIVNIDINSSSPISKMSLIWSSYSFDEKIDKQAFTEIQENNEEELNDVRDSFSVLKDFGVSFDTLLIAIRENFWKEDFKENLKSVVANFSRDIYSDLEDVYETTEIKSDEQIKESDISSFADIDSPNDLRLKIENVKEKFLKIQSKIWDVQTWILKNYQTQMKELLEIKIEQKEKQKKVLEFMGKSGFDLIPKEITNRIIRELQSNTLIIPWLNLSVKNIDLKNWNFWENSAFIDKEAWINIGSKTNLVKFVNKIISWNVDEPLSVDGITNWVSVADPNFLKHKFLEADVVSGMGWNYGKVIENLRKIS